VHRDLPPTRVWGFNNSSPGPIFETRSGYGLLVEWANELPTHHFLPIALQFRDVSRGKPLPHSLSEEEKRKVGLTRQTWKLEVISDPDNPATVRHLGSGDLAG